MEPKPPDLTADARLQRMVDVRVVGVPLEELLAKLSDGKLRLVTGRSCAAQKVQICLKHRSLVEVMQSLAQLLPGAWDALPNNSGYRLNMSARAIKRREDWWRLYQSEREQVLADQRRYLLNVLRNGEPPAAIRENIDPYADAQIAAVGNFFRSLPVSLQERLAVQMNETAFMGFQGFGFGTGDDEGAVVVALSELPESVQSLIRAQVVRQMAGSSPISSWRDVTIRLANGGLGFLAEVDVPGGPFLGSSFSLFVHYDLNRFVLMLDHDLFRHLVHKQGIRAPQGWKLLAAYQDSRVWNNDRPANPRRPSGNRPRRAERLRWLGENADVEFVADYYSLEGSPMSLPNAPIAAPDVKTEMDQLAVEQDTSWKQGSNKIYLFRDNRWYRDDYLEVPANLLRRWLALSLPFPQELKPDFIAANQSAAPPQARMQKWMDRAAEFVSALTPYQIATGLRYYHPGDDEETQKLLDENLKKMMHYTGFAPGRMHAGEGYPFWNDALTILHRYNTVRFYAALNADARTAILNNMLRYETLTPEQQSRAQFLLPDLQTLLLRNTHAPIVLGMQPNVHAEVPDRGPLLGRLFLVSPTLNRAVEP